MKRTKLILASLTAAASFGALTLAPQAQAQQMVQQRTDAPATYSKAQVYGNGNNTPAPGNRNWMSTSYGGGRCVGPVSFCNTYFGN